jgi:bifunctional non-homologous end joining protein LigD
MPAEDRPQPTRPETDAGRSFVIQEHHASSLHWDFRLERDGVLVSWALPKGLPLDPGQNHLAVPTEDHPLEYGSFEGVIPPDEYGGGNVVIWDSGTYDTEKWSDHEVMVRLHGKGQAQGHYVLFRTDPKRWMIHRMDPRPPGWVPPPAKVAPMLCTPGPLPKDDKGWAYEFKWDGERVVATIDGGRIRLTTRNGNDVTSTYPELAALAEGAGSRPMVLDGEVVAYDGTKPSFGLLQQRMGVVDRSRARRLSHEVPVTFLVFDVVYLDGSQTDSLPYDQRRALLEGLGLNGPNWQVPPSFSDAAGADVLRVSLEHGMEGVVAKRRASTYRQGRRSPDWIKVKHVRMQEVVVGGWTGGTGHRSSSIGALLLGIPAPGGLAYVGKVGTGFTDRSLGDIARLLKPLARKTSPFTDTLPRAQAVGAHWVTPTVVGEVRYSEWTRDQRLRHPSWRGLRPDKSASDVMRES